MEEFIHQGKHQDIPDDVSRISDKEMKKIMKYAVDEVNFYLWLKKNKELTYKSVILFGSGITSHWDKPRNPESMYDELLKILSRHDKH